MPDTPVIGAKTTFAYSATLGGSYTAFANIEGITPGALDVSSAPVDTFDAPLLNSAVPTGDKIPGWATQGAWGAKLKFLKTQYATIRGLVGLGKFYKVIFPDGSGFNFPGFISKLGNEVPLKETMTCDIMVEVTGGAAPFAVAQT